MPKTIENPIREGMPSKIYLAAYGEPLSVYEIAKRIHRVEKSNVPRTDQIYRIVKDKYPNYFERETIEGKRGRPKPIKSRAEPLLKEVEDAVKSKLSDSEKEILLWILDSKEFRSFVGDVVVKDMDFKGDVNAADKLMSSLCMCAAYTWHIKETVEMTGIESHRLPLMAGEMVLSSEIEKLENVRFPEALLDFLALILEVAPSSLLKKLLTTHPTWGSMFDPCLILKALPRESDPRHIF